REHPVLAREPSPAHRSRPALLRPHARGDVGGAERRLRRDRLVVPGRVRGADGRTLMERYLSRDARNLRPSAIRAFAKLINDPNVISFAGGVPSPETFPAERVAEIAERVIRERRAVALQYGPTAGLPRLREFVAGVCRGRGIDCTAD